MELKLVSGDYVPDGIGGFIRLTGREALLQRVLYRLCVKRGSFPPLPEMGSRLYLLPKLKASEREAMALLYAQEALEDEAVSVTAVELRPAGSGALSVAVSMDYTGGELVAELTVS